MLPLSFASPVPRPPLERPFPPWTSLLDLPLPGDGWSARMEDAVLHGCIPVIIADGVHSVFESLLGVDSFGLRVPEEQVGNILQVLLSVPEKTIRSKQAALGRVWHR